jgi:hypothetical protein
MEITLDSTDIAILRELQRDSRLSVRQLSRLVHRSPTPVFERVRRLENEGIIAAYTVRIDQEKAGISFIVFCNVKLRRINTTIHEQFAASIAAMPQVTECYNVSGSFDYLLKITVPDMASYRRFVTEGLGVLDAVESVQSIFVMQTIKSAPLPL